MVRNGKEDIASTTIKWRIQNLTIGMDGPSKSRPAARGLSMGAIIIPWGNTISDVWIASVPVVSFPTINRNGKNPMCVIPKYVVPPILMSLDPGI